MIRSAEEAWRTSMMEWRKRLVRFREKWQQFSCCKDSGMWQYVNDVRIICRFFDLSNPSPLSAFGTNLEYMIHTTSERPIEILSLLADADMMLPIITDYRPVPIYYRYSCNWPIHLESADIKWIGRYKILSAQYLSVILVTYGHYTDQYVPIWADIGRFNGYRPNPGISVNCR